MTGDARLFFAASPAPEAQRELGNVAEALERQCGGRAVPVRNMHLTLVFLGNVARSRMARVEAVAATVKAPRFELRLDRVAWWRHNRIVWAGAARCPESLAALVKALEQGLSSEEFHFDARPYVPHVTLLRKARRAPAAAEVPGVAWPVSRFALMESVPRAGGPVYEMLREWPLAT